MFTLKTECSSTSRKVVNQSASVVLDLHTLHCFQTVVLEKTLESLLDRKEIKPVHPKGNQSSIFIGRTDAEAETPILSPSDAKN